MTEISRRQLGAIAAAGALSLSSTGTLASAGANSASVPFDAMPYVHPEFRPLMRPLLGMANKSLSTIGALRQARQSPPFPAPQPAATPSWEERTIPGHSGNPDVKVYVINAGTKGALRPAIIDIHGGGFVIGSARDGIAPLQALAQALDCVIVTVEYRLAPETKFPGALEDNYAALKWLYAHAEELGADKARIAVTGNSAGGGHAAMLTVAARDRGEVPVMFQALTYPMLDDRTGSTVRKPPQQGAFVWTPESNRFGWTSLLGVPAGSARVPVGSVPARESNLKGLPPTFIGVGSIDLFVDEDVDYARRLLDAGVFVELVVVPGGFHGFNMFTNTNVVQRYNDYYMAVMRQGLGLNWK